MAIKHLEGYVRFGDISRDRLGKQAQYGSRYINGGEGYPALGKGLRLVNDDPSDYHGWYIHNDDVEESVLRYLAIGGRVAS